MATQNVSKRADGGKPTRREFLVTGCVALSGASVGLRPQRLRAQASSAALTRCCPRSKTLSSDSLTRLPSASQEKRNSLHFVDAANGRVTITGGTLWAAGRGAGEATRSTNQGGGGSGGVSGPGYSRGGREAPSRSRSLRSSPSMVRGPAEPLW